MCLVLRQTFFEDVKQFKNFHFNVLCHSHIHTKCPLCKTFWGPFFTMAIIFLPTKLDQNENRLSKKEATFASATTKQIAGQILSPQWTRPPVSLNADRSQESQVFNNCNELYIVLPLKTIQWFVTITPFWFTTCEELPNSFHR